MALLRQHNSPYTYVKPVNKDEAASVILDPEIYDRITDDRCPQITELWDDEYYGGYVDGEIVSVATFETFLDGLKVHFMVLKEYRSYARSLFEQSLSGHSGVVYAQIPACFMTTINFVKHHGFKLVKVEPESYIKYGEHHDRHLLKREMQCHS